MTKVSGIKFFLLAIVFAACWPLAAHAQSFEVVTGKAFDSAIPKDFYLEGNAIPTEKRNSALVKTPAGARALFGLIDTAGYSSQIQQKYIGMIISEGKVSVCGISLGVGSYGFGLDRKADKFFVYDQAGGKAGECTPKKDAALKQPKPLLVEAKAGAPAKLYLGRYELELQ